MEKFGVETSHTEFEKTGAEDCPKCGSELLPGVPPRCPTHGTRYLEKPPCTTTRSRSPVPPSKR